MLPGVLEGGTVLYPLGWRRCPPFFVCITYLIFDVCYQKFMLLKNICISTAYAYMSEYISNPSYFLRI